MLNIPIKMKMIGSGRHSICPKKAKDPKFSKVVLTSPLKAES